ncbi:MAG: carboxypeptidase-like regulatory domain-containing protein, partial [Flavobacteriaceae bacterium]|nr:carboxypeptidase-like regulatory domain-containing protein [Flavobacteriaceae bacterium]
MALNLKYSLFFLLISVSMSYANLIDDQDPPKKISIYWDISMSMRNRDIQNDIAYLEDYFKDGRDYDITFKAFNNQIVQQETIQVREGNWRALRLELENAIYDGATSYTSLFQESGQEEYLLFSDATEGFDKLEFPTDKKISIINSTVDSGKRTFDANISYTNVYDPTNTSIEKTIKVAGVGNVQSVSGIVSDELGPLVGANVIIKNKNKGTTTDADGRYRINAKKGDIIVFSYLGKKAVRLSIQDKNVIDVVMNESNEGLDEVTVTAKKNDDGTIQTAYGKKDKKRIGYDVQSLSQDDLSKTATNVNQSIQGKLTGFGHRTNTDISKFTVRSLQTINGDTFGLVVIDGIPQRKSTSSNGLSGSSSGADADFSWLNPEDIVDITLLKSMAATNKYGTLGINGVLEITTKNAIQKKVTDPKDPRLGTTDTYSEDTKMIENLPKTSYINALQESTSVDEAYNTYLQLRDQHQNKFEYFLDVYDYFKGWKNKAISNRILESAADINFDNVIVLKAIAYKFQEAGEHDMAVKIFQRIVSLSPKSSQSHRDLAQAYHYADQHKKGYDIYHKIITGRNSYGANFIGLMPTIENEYRNLISKHRSILDVSKTPPQYLNKATLDYRVVFEWNDLEAEFDMQIVNPQKRFFTLPHTTSGDARRMKMEKAQGYGLEENFLTNSD